MHQITFTVKCEWDPDAKVWFVESSNVPGLVGEAPTIEAMQQLLRVRVPELVALNMPNLRTKDCEVPLELLWTEHSNVRIAC